MNNLSIDLTTLEELFKILEKPLTKKKRILLIRHGQSEGNVKNLFYGSVDYPLTELGKVQARIVSPLFKKYFNSFDTFSTSNLMRAIETYTECLCLSEQTSNLGNMKIKNMPDLLQKDKRKSVSWDGDWCTKTEDCLVVDYISVPDQDKLEKMTKYDILKNSILKKEDPLIKEPKSKIIILEITQRESECCNGSSDAGVQLGSNGELYL
jgi:hypothetical protein